ncbi:MAG TPA: helix-turn-helix domain-containing protein [Herbaspirillum sp.]
MAGVRQFNEAEALEKALVLFWQKGFSDTSMQELAAATGVQRGSLYNAYQDKETLFLRVFDLYKERVLSQAGKELDQPKLRDALQSFFNFIIGSITTGAPTRGCMATKSAFGRDVIDASIQTVLQELIDGYERILIERFERIGKNGQTEALAIPAKDAARLIVTFARGLVVMERIYQDKARLLDTAESLITLLSGAEKPKHRRAA